MLQNARVTAFTVSELLRENQQGRGGKITPLFPPFTFKLGLRTDTSPESLPKVQALEETQTYGVVQ